MYKFSYAHLINFNLYFEIIYLPLLSQNSQFIILWRISSLGLDTITMANFKLHWLLISSILNSPIPNSNGAIFYSWTFWSQQTFFNFLLLPIAILHIQTKTLINNHIDVKKNQKYTKQVLPKSKKTKTSLLNAPSLTKEQRHIRKQIKRLFTKFSTFSKDQKHRIKLLSLWKEHQ